MGCGTSTEQEQERISIPSRQFPVHTPSETYHQFHHDGDQNSFFQCLIPLFNHIDESPERQKQFYNLMSNRMGQLYTHTLGKIEDKLIKQQIGVDDLKVNFSKIILLQILNIVNKLQTKSNWKKHQLKFFSSIAKCQKKIIQFLKFKYPRNKKDFVPTELDELFYGIDDSEHTDYDLLINAKVNFDYESIRAYERKEVVKQIKTFLNAIIRESNRSFDMFRQRMEDMFKNLDGSFKIGRKISQNVSVYSDIESENLQIHSPQIFRVIIKWISSMDGVFINTLQRLKQFKYLKIVEQNEDQFTYFPLYTGKNTIISSITAALEPGSKAYIKQQENQQNALANFNDNLAKILTKKTDIPEINQNQIKTIKYAKYISRFVEFLAIEKLVYLITELSYLREKMEKKNRKGIDLITCNVNDLLRSQYMGNKNGIMEVFQRLKKLQSDNLIKIIRIKNRFATPLNDALVNFMFVGEEEQDHSFIVCELQLILKKDIYNENTKNKAYESVNHVLYELQRSIFGPMAQMSLLLTHHDTRMGYEKKIKLQKKPLKSMRCPDNEILQCEYDLQIPYACSLCSQFYHINQNSFPIYHCVNCNFYVCPQCLFQFDDEMMEECYTKELFAYIRDNHIHELDEHQDFGFFFFNKNFLKVSQIQRKGKNFFDCLQEKMTDMEQEYAFVFSFSQGKKNLNIYTTNSGELLPTFYDFLPRYQRKTFRSKKFGTFDIVFFLDSTCNVQKKPMKDTNLTTIPLVNIEFSQKRVKQMYYFKWQNHLCMVDIGEQVKESESQSSFKNASIDKTEEVERILQNYKPRDGQLLLDYLDLNNLDFGEIIIQNVRFAKLKSNRIKDISPILQFDSLEEIDASRNQIFQLDIVRQYKKLRIMNFSQNFIEVVEGLNDENLPNSKEINLASNNLQNFPRMHLSHLLWLNLDNNRLENLDGFAKSFLPKLRKLSLSENKIEQIPAIDMPQLLDLQAQENKIKYINFLLKCEKIEQVFLSKNEIINIPQMQLQQLQKLVLSYNSLTNISTLTGCIFNKLIELDLSNNKIKQIPILKFQQLLNLDLSNNEIELMHNLTQSKMLINLQTLDISNNRILDLCVLNLQSLTTLDMSHNKLVDISTLYHCDVKKLAQLDVSFNNISKIAKIDQPQLIKLNLQNNSLQSMQYLTLSVMPNLKTLNISHNKISQFISAQFPSLQSLNIQRNQLVTVHEIPMEHLEVLKILNMNQNKIAVLPAMHLQSLVKLQLNKNNIVNVQQFKLSTMSKLQELDIRFNILNTFPPMHLPQLKVLQLDSNEINDMTGLAMGNLPSLQELQLTNNKLATLQVLKMQKLSILNLEKNMLEEITILQQYVTPQISIINLKKNAITTVCSLVSASLTQIDLSFNKITDIDPFFKSQLPKLLVIKLNNNQIEGRLPVANFQGLKLLEIAKNNINSFHDFSRSSKLPKLDTFKANNNKVQELVQFNFPKLKDLNIANNSSLKVITDFSYSQMPKIQKINLQNCQIAQLPKLQFNTLTQLNLDNNKITKLDNEFERSQLPSLQRLFLRANAIKDWPQDLVLQKLTKLNLAQNQLTDFFHINKETVPELKQLNLKKNKIESVHQIQLPKMVVLNLDENPLIEKDVKMDTLSLGQSKVNKNLKLTLNKRSSQRSNQVVEINKLQNKMSLA